MMTHHMVHESFKNNISNNTHNIAQEAILFSGGANAPSRCNPGSYIASYVLSSCECQGSD